MDLTSVKNQREELSRIEAELSKPETASNPNQLRTLTKRHSHLKNIIEAFDALHKLSHQILEAKEILSDGTNDQELIDLANEELEQAESEKEKEEGKLKKLLLPRDPEDDANTIMEIRAGTGGEEAALFAADLYRMYSRYAEIRGWKIEGMDTHHAGQGGLKEIVFAVNGNSVHSFLKYEGGVHRVQRVPATETSGRIHTSAASVAVMPEAEDIVIAIEPNELKVDVFRASGPGGQSVNTTDSAVRITHIPSGLVVSCQDEKSQLKNKNKAMRVLKVRLSELYKQEAADVRSEQRRSMVGSGDRSEKIRTYNFPQNRVTDHRIGLTVHALEEILGGQLDKVIEPLIDHDTKERLKALGEESKL